MDDEDEGIFPSAFPRFRFNSLSMTSVVFANPTMPSIIRFIIGGMMTLTGIL